MSTRFAWLLGLLVLVLVGFLVACGSHFSPSSDGLLLVPSLGSAVVQAFSFNLSSGHASSINTAPPIPGPPSQGSVASIILDPAGAFAYLTTSSTPNPVQSPCTTVNSLATYKVNSNGTLSTIGTTPLGSNPPAALAMDSAGKFLFVANSATCVQSGTSAIAGKISVFSIGSNASLTEVAGSPFSVPATLGGPPANPVALAITPTIFPALHAACSGTAAPTTEYLYVADAANDVLWEFSVDSSSGVLAAPPNNIAVPGFPTGSVPSGVAVDACNRFVYAANQNSNDISTYTICNGGPASSTSCQSSNGNLVPVPASPFAAGNGPAAIAVDPLANFVYVVNKQANTISGYRISPASGSLGTPSTVTTGTTPVSIAIRNDDVWVFVTNYGSASVSEYSLTPATGGLSPQAPITTDNFPYGVAVK
jgi:6-phosphogluconolactonase (cycloisomerase 2 family)